MSKRAVGMGGKKLSIVLGASVVLLSTAFLAYFVYRNWATLTSHRWQISWPQLALTLLLDLCAYVIAIAGWHSIIKRLAGSADLALNAKIYCYGAVAGRLPGVAWSILTRVVMYDPMGISKAVVGLASVLEMILTAVSGIVLYLVLTPFTLPYVARFGAPAIVAALLLGAALIHPRLVTYAVRRVKQDALPVSLNYGDTGRWLFIYLLTWILSGFLLHTTVNILYPLPAARALQIIADWTLAGVLTSFVTFVPTSLGLKEVTLTVLMSRYMPEYIAVVAAILMRALTIAYAVLWTLCSARLPSARPGRT